MELAEFLEVTRAWPQGGRRKWWGSIRCFLALLCIAAFSGCGDNGGAGESGAPAPTLAYVVSECRSGIDGLSGWQELRVRNGEGAPLTVKRLETLDFLRVPGIEVCGIFGSGRFGPGSVAAGVFQRLGVTPDGTGIVFEVTPDFSVLPIDVPPQEVGIFFVRADGAGLRRLTAPSQVRSFTFLINDLRSIRPTEPLFAFSPDGRAMAFTDVGPGPVGEEAEQIVTVDLATGARTVITHLPPAPSPLSLPAAAGTCCPRFVDSETLLFATTADVEGLNPGGGVAIFQVRTDGSGLAPVRLPATLPGIATPPIPGVSGAVESGVGLLFLLEAPVNDFPLDPGLPAGVLEVHRFEDQTAQRLTSFRRVDTVDPLLSTDSQEIFFASSADPAGANPSESCQIFSMNTSGGELRQLTNFAEGEHSMNGCLFGPPPGCSAAFLFQDAVTQTLLFYSSCDPFGTNENGGEIFAIAPDGTGLRQITDTRGFYSEDDGTIVAEMPGPLAYPIAPLR